MPPVKEREMLFWQQWDLMQSWLASGLTLMLSSLDISRHFRSRLQALPHHPDHTPSLRQGHVRSSMLGCYVAVALPISDQLLFDHTFTIE